MDNSTVCLESLLCFHMKHKLNKSQEGPSRALCKFAGQCKSFSKEGQRSHSRSHVKLYGTVGKALSQGPHMPNNNALSLRIKVMANVKVFF